MPLNQISTNVWQLDIVFDGGTAELFKFPTGAPIRGCRSAGTRRCCGWRRVVRGHTRTPSEAYLPSRQSFPLSLTIA